MIPDCCPPFFSTRPPPTESASTTPLLPASSPIPDELFQSRVASSLSLSTSQESNYVTPPTTPHLLSLSLDRLSTEVKEEQPQKKERTFKEIFTLSTLQKFEGNWELFSKNKIVEIIVKFFLYENNEGAHPPKTIEFIFNHANKLRNKFLENTKISDAATFPAVNYIALITSLNIWSDKDYTLQSHSYIFTHIKSDKQMQINLKPYGWTPDIAAQSKNLSISINRLKEIQHHFLEGIKWDLELTETARREKNTPLL